MKGDNELHLNTATMIEAVQQWLDSRMVRDAPTVTIVKPSGKGDSMFVVGLSADADRPAAPQEEVPCVNPRSAKP